MNPDNFRGNMYNNSNEVNTVSIATAGDRYSEMYDAGSGDLEIFKIHEADVLVAWCWCRHCANR